MQSGASPHFRIERHRAGGGGECPPRVVRAAVVRDDSRPPWECVHVAQYVLIAEPYARLLYSWRGIGGVPPPSPRPAFTPKPSSGS